jgi:hypothetical protein
VLEPQSTALFLLLLVMFCGLAGWLVLARPLVIRLLAACLAFIPAMLFGMAAVNKHYNHYRTWGSITADLGGQGPSQVAAPSIDQASAQLPGLSRDGCCPGPPSGVSAGVAAAAARHPDRAPARAAPSAGAGPRPAPGAGRPPGRARRATG